MPLLQLKTQMKFNQAEIQTGQPEIQRLQQEAQVYSGSPERHARQSKRRCRDMMRDTDTMKKEYADLLGKKQESALATSLEMRQEGAQFRIIDPPSLARQAAVPRPLQVLPGRYRCRHRAGDSVRIRLGVPGRSYPRRAGACPKPRHCRCWRKFRRCRRRGSYAGHDWRHGWPWPHLVVIMIALPSGVVYAYFWG